ncbi:diheme cytochrome c-553 [Aequorivita sp. SDUM287046]|uniref:Diheme cytochrome c-553 n=1 Tax=Aequorivita aurantiaca TaxID=3053356 RepID=A0ABT8DNQ4_9FLAO|nr:diheme cytochrome c-553 [Aequorivita aurantiaca]MDN3724883.1 diheme cytochrome c-553 [Aequorivita aurantiaca]
MKKQLLSQAVLCMLLTACNFEKKEEATPQIYEPQTEETAESPVKRGEMLTNAVGCHDCHSPKKMTERGPIFDPDRLLSGHPANEILPSYDLATAKNYVLFNQGSTASIGPWGTSFSSNLTPDETGIGSWTEEQFLTAITHGKFKGMENGRNLLPPMPWQTIAQLPAKDLKAIFAYLKSIKPIENIVPAPIPPKV